MVIRPTGAQSWRRAFAICDPQFAKGSDNSIPYLCQSEPAEPAHIRYLRSMTSGTLILRASVDARSCRDFTLLEIDSDAQFCLSQQHARPAPQANSGVRVLSLISMLAIFLSIVPIERNDLSCRYEGIFRTL
jgi:hypothetical protein